MTIFAIAAPSVAGLIAGLVLLRKTPTLRNYRQQKTVRESLGIIVPARDEANNLPRLLGSLPKSAEALEVVVVDDESSDDTAAIARLHGARVLSSQPLPAGWLGKPWACWQGAGTVDRDALLFLDADTYFVADGVQCLRNCFAALPSNGVASVLPFHRMNCWYEQLSLFFNLLMAMGAGGFGGVDDAHMFGQCMMVSRALYERAGGHAAVRAERLENMQLAKHFRQAGGCMATFTGAGVLEMRMFPDGFAQLHSSWKRSSATGASASTPRILMLAYLFLSGCVYAFLCLIAVSGRMRLIAAGIYLAYVCLLAFQSRQLGTYRILTAVLYPLPLIFYFFVFAEAKSEGFSGKKISWRGREL